MQTFAHRVANDQLVKRQSTYLKEESKHTQNQDNERNELILMQMNLQ